jgi:hypothetical protein
MKICLAYGVTANCKELILPFRESHFGRTASIRLISPKSGLLEFLNIYIIGPGEHLGKKILRFFLLNRDSERIPCSLLRG